MLLGKLSVDSVSADLRKSADVCGRARLFGCVEFDFFRLCGHPRFRGLGFRWRQNRFDTGRPHRSAANANQNHPAGAVVKGRPARKQRSATSDNVSYVRFGVYFCLRFCRVLFLRSGLWGFSRTPPLLLPIATRNSQIFTGNIGFLVELSQTKEDKKEK